MEFEFTKDGIIFEKVFNDLDDFVFGFMEILDSGNIGYVIVSGYVSILFGRSRSSEDVDMIIQDLGLEGFKKLWDKLLETYECHNTEDPIEAYNEYLKTGHAIRFSLKNNFIPNMEVKHPKTSLDEWVLENRKKTVVNGKTVYISPLELQIPYKLFLGSGKDIEDARHLHTLFKDKLEKDILEDFTKKLGVGEASRKYLK